MDFSADPADTHFREEIRAFIRAHLPRDIAARTRLNFRPDRADVQAWNAILHRKGWSAPAWPREHGGTGWPARHQLIFLEECADADAPPLSPFGLMLVGPVIYSFGSESQKRTFLPGILSGETFWCQGFSEPEAGSDLASLHTRAMRKGDKWIVTGRKLWTSHAHYSDMMVCLARTDPEAKPQAGLSLFLIDMRTPGISSRPVITIDRSHDVNEVTLDQVEVPAENLVGAANKGWDYAKFLLTHERTFSAHIPRSRRALRWLKDIAAHQRANGRTLAQDEPFARKLAAAEIELKALEFCVLRTLASEGPSPDVAAILKLRGSEIEQRLSSLVVEALGVRALRHFADPSYNGDLPNMPYEEADEPGAMGTHLFLRAATIYSGTNEIQRNLIARHVLGLP
jgi:alkylation response protein AidB-like acyl-CoA dehydrogenase